MRDVCVPPGMLVACRKREDDERFCLKEWCDLWAPSCALVTCWSMRPALNVQDQPSLSRLVYGNVVDMDLSQIVVSAVRDSVRASSSIVTIVEVSAGPITTDGDVDDETEVLERSSNVARLVSPESDRGSPRIGIRVTALDVLRDLVPLEPPDGNLLVVPKRGEYPTSCHVEWMTSTSLDVCEGATVVVAAGAQALSGDEVPGETLADCTVCAPVQGSNVGARLTVGAGMEGVLVGRILVDEFYNVDLSAIRPSRANSPKCRPDGGSMSEPPKICDHETAVVGSLAGDTDGSPVATRGNVGDIINLQHSGAIGLNVGEVLGVLLGFVDHISVGWISIGEEIPSVEKRLASVFVLQLEFVIPCDVVMS